MCLGLRIPLAHGGRTESRGGCSGCGLLGSGCGLLTGDVTETSGVEERGRAGRCGVVISGDLERRREGW